MTPGSAERVADYVADYEVVKPLGSGPRGEVFLARPPVRLNVDLEVVAVRVHRGIATAATFEHAGTELRRAAAARSPYLVTLLDTGHERGDWYLAMEYLPGSTLGAPAHPTAALRAVSDAARAAGDLHAVGLVHRAIRPANVYIAPYGAKLADPDLSRIFRPGLLIPTGGGTAAAFIDPLLLRGEPARPYHDVWSLGALLHQVAAGVGLYGEVETDALAALRRVIGSGQSVSGVLPAQLADLVRACLATPADRPTAMEVADVLDRLSRP